MEYNTVQNSRLIHAVEAILFAYGQPIRIEDLCYALNEEQATVEEAIEKLQSIYQYDRAGIRLIRLENSYQLCTAVEYADIIRKVLQKKESKPFGRPALEVLAIIAYFQPTTQSYIDEIRGVDSSYWISWLIEREMIQQLGQLSRRGQPNIYGTTLEFLRMFHLNSLNDLPDLKGNNKNEDIGQMLSQWDELEGLIPDC